jgi:hypothetical protein
MKTKGLMIINHNVPCSCACRYCFFQSSKSSSGINYLRGEKQAKRFAEWRTQNNIDDFFLNYTISHCADFLEIFQNIRLNRSFNFIGASFLQCNGIGLKSDVDLKAYLQGVKAAGVEKIDTTFYGTKDYQDYFSSRNGDFNYMLKLLEVSSLIGLEANPSIFVCEDNKDQLDELFSILNGFSCVQHIHSFLQDYRGNGRKLESIRLSNNSFESLSESIKSTFNKSLYKTEKEWLEGSHFPEYTARNLILALSPENIDMVECMSCSEIISYIEELDDTYYKSTPGINDLAKIYGDKKNERLYRARDLYWKWQRQYIADNNLKLHDVTDERVCGSHRF